MNITWRIIISYRRARGSSVSIGPIPRLTWCPPMPVPPRTRVCSTCFPWTWCRWMLNIQPLQVWVRDNSPPPPHPSVRLPGVCVCVDLPFFLHTGVISTSPLKLELEFEPVLPNTCTWYLCCTYQYLSRIQFSGNKLKQDVTYAYL